MNILKYASAVCLSAVLATVPLSASYAAPAEEIARTSTLPSFEAGVRRFVFEVPAGADRAAQIPLIVVDGARPGPTLTLLSGLHGAEYATAVALERLVDGIDFKTLSGRVVILPVINVEAFKQAAPCANPSDGKNLNRAFPGYLAGTQSERIAAMLASEFILHSDVVLDYHAGDIDEQLTPYSYWVKTGDAAQDAYRLRLLHAFGNPYIIHFDATALALENASIPGTYGNVAAPDALAQKRQAIPAKQTELSAIWPLSVRVRSAVSQIGTAAAGACRSIGWNEGSDGGIDVGGNILIRKAGPHPYC